MNRLIHSPEQLREFISLLPDLGKTEVYFHSMSCRNKYLTDEEREHYAIGRAEMFFGAISRDREKLYRNICRCETNPEAFTGKTGVALPTKAMVIYMNLHTSDSIKAFRHFQSTINEEMARITDNAINGRENEGGLRLGYQCAF